MGAAQEAAWHALLDLHDTHPTGWTLIGGQLVHLHCAERGYAPQRPTEDADTVVDVRVTDGLSPVTEALRTMGFRADPSADEVAHRWRRGNAQIDVLIPEGTGPRSASRPSASGFPTVAAPGGTQALHRTETVPVQVGDRTGSIPRPTLLSAMILKAAARIETTGSGRDRHCFDFAALAATLARTDLDAVELNKKDKQRLRKMIEHTHQTSGALEAHPNAERRLAFLERSLT